MPFPNGGPQPSLDLISPPHPQSAFESDMSEIILCQNEVDLALKNLQTWMKDESVSTNLVSPVGWVMVGGGGSGGPEHRAACPRPLLP